MNTINNTAIVEAKSKLVKTVNEILQSGVPIAIVDLMMDIIGSEVKTTLQNQIQQEAKQSAELERIKSEQVEWQEAE